ncbi:MAG: peptide deformylase [Clostridia bacterium]|nr:peptide deformylase [Clostridia bacterium]
MVRNIIKDIFIFRKAEEATQADLNIAQDLLDTLNANKAICVGMAANMIGFNKRIISFMTPFGASVLINPYIVSHSKEYYETEEGCLSLSGVRKTKRYEKITVEYTDMAFKSHRAEFSGYTAQIIQHEIDHCEGVII